MNKMVPTDIIRYWPFSINDLREESRLLGEGAARVCWVSVDMTSEKVMAQVVFYIMARGSYDSL